MTKLTTTPKQPSLITAMRDLVPHRPLSYNEALILAERQATLLLKRSGVEAPSVSTDLIAELPRIDVQIVPSLPRSGITAYSRGKWRIRINGAEPANRIRFTIAHEIKHVLDARDEDTIFGDFGSGYERKVAIESVCDYFAASFLMPRKLVKKYWFRGSQDVHELAWHFEVSPQAMQIRLQHLGLLDPQPRCDGPRRFTTGRRRYFRTSSLAPLHALALTPLPVRTNA